MRARCAYRDRNRGVPPLSAKARPVILGFHDPDLAQITRNSPVLTRAGKTLIVQIAASHNWVLGAGDVESSFLQGEQLDREQPIYLIPPSDPILKDAGAFPAPLYEIVGNVYGSANGPYLWAMHVIATMLSFGFVQHSLDVMLFLWYDSSGGLLCIVGFHVDDALLAMSERFDFDLIQNAFAWGKWKFAPETIESLGEIHDYISDGEFAGCFYIHQSQYSTQIPLVAVPTMSSKRDDDQLTASEREDYNSSLGSMNWLAGRTRPDIASAVSLANRSSPTLKDFRAIMKEVARLHTTSEAGLLIIPVPLDACILVSFADSSWANAENLRTQIGRLLLLAPITILTQTVAVSVWEHKSKRTARVVRSTLAGEACATDAGVDAAFYFRRSFPKSLREIPRRNPTASLTFTLSPIANIFTTRFVR